MFGNVQNYSVWVALIHFADIIIRNTFKCSTWVALLDFNIRYTACG